MLAIVGITAICITALQMGIDGQLAYVAIASIAGIAGYELRERMNGERSKIA